MSIFLVIATIVGLFFLWMQAKDKLYPENVVFDTFFVSVIGGVIAARMSAIMLNFQLFQFSFLSWMLPHKYPGMYLPLGIVGAIVLMWYMLRRKTDPPFWGFLVIMIRSFWIALIIFYSGMVFYGWEVGKQTQMPWGRHPVALYKLLLLIIAFILYRRIRNSRTFSARSESIVTLMIVAAIVFFVDNFVEFRVYYGKLALDQIGYLGILIACSIFFVAGERVRFKLTRGKEKK